MQSHDSNTSIINSQPLVKSGTDASLDRREDARLRAGNGIRDEVVFPRLRALGVAEGDLHRVAMKLCRDVQYGLDVDGSIAALLGIARSPFGHGTIAVPEVV